MKKGFWKYFVWLLLVVLLFTAIDAIIHLTFEPLEIYYYPIPSFLLFITSNPTFWYAIGKFFGTTIIGILIYSLIKRIKNYKLAVLIFTVIITALLEVRYILSGYYTPVWHIYNFIQHTIVLYLAAYLVFKKSKAFS